MCNFYKSVRNMRISWETEMDVLLESMRIVKGGRVLFQKKSRIFNTLDVGLRFGRLRGRRQIEVYAGRITKSSSGRRNTERNT